MEFGLPFLLVRICVPAPRMLLPLKASDLASFMAVQFGGYIMLPNHKHQNRSEAPEIALNVAWNDNVLRFISVCLHLLKYTCCTCTEMEFSQTLTIHPFPRPLLNWSLSHLTVCERWTTPWTGHQSIAGHKKA